ncbi:MAG: hypothetical protein ACR2O1_13030 [Boseongicola sp.]
MKLNIFLAGAYLALAACSASTAGLGGGDEGDGGGVGGGGGGGGGVPGDTCIGVFICDGDVVAVSYDSATDTLIITGTPFDETPLAATYVSAGLTNGIPTYTNDESPFNSYTAYYVESAGGEIAVGATGIDGYQDFGYGGTFILLSDAASVPSTGLAEFTGGVAGLVAYDGSGALDQSAGTVLMQVDFTDNRIKGFVTGRTFTGGAGTNPGTLVLNDTTIVSGAFSGTVNSYNGPDVAESGTYGGYFAGGSGDYIGGIYEATNPDWMPDITSRDTGVFIATSCGGICP